MQTCRLPFAIRCTCLLLAAVMLSVAAWAQTPALPDGRATAGPPAPGQTVVTRDDQGRVTVRAIRLTSPLNLDGRLDEAVYGQVEPATGFVQQEPREGEPATERTDVWVFFDAENVYVSGRMWDTQPDRIVANEMRRDNRNIFQNDNFGVAFDTYNNQRTGFFFQTNPLGGLRDAVVADEGEPNYEWDTVWDVKTSRFEQGWQAEIAIPFKSMRYAGGHEQVWGVNFRRVVRSKNETSLLTRIPASYGGRGITMFSLAATLVGIEPPRASRNLELKPYAISRVTTDRALTPAVSNDLDGDLGFDAKLGLTRSLIADFTYNTDFAQVEDDEQQVNLTRFSLFFPEKREFFLEGQGIFEFGGARGGGFGGGGDTPIIFFSRRIGLQNGVTVPIRTGGRLTGRAGPYSVGFLNIQTEDSARAEAASTNFSVVRLRRDILRRSNAGAIYTRRGPSIDSGGSNEVYGFDASLAFFENVEVTSYYARSRTPGVSGDEDSYRFDFDYGADRYGVRFEHLKVGDDFKPEVGFVRRADFRQTSGSLRFSPRPSGLKGIRKLSWNTRLDYLESTAGVPESRELDGSFQIEFESGDQFEVEHSHFFEFLEEPFEVATGITLPTGGYTFDELSAQYEMGPQRRFSGRLSMTTGSFYSGDRTEAGYNGRFEVTPQLSVEPRVSVNWVDLPEGNFTTKLVSSRITYTLSPRMFAGALVQYNSSSEALTSNIRFRWEYEPGSDLFVVYTEGRDTLAPGYPALQNRGFVIKLTRLFRF